MGDPGFTADLEGTKMKQARHSLCNCWCYVGSEDDFVLLYSLPFGHPSPCKLLSAGLAQTAINKRKGK